MCEEMGTRLYNWQLCRICAQHNCVLIDIYDENGIDMQLEDKINQYLPITVTADDDLPLFVCFSCIDKLNTTHELIVSCIETNNRLNHLLQMKEKLTSGENEKRDLAAANLHLGKEKFEMATEVISVGLPDINTDLTVGFGNNGSTEKKIKNFQISDCISSVAEQTDKTNTKTSIISDCFTSDGRKKNGMSNKSSINDCLSKTPEEIMDCLNGKSAYQDINEQMSNIHIQTDGKTEIISTDEPVGDEVLCSADNKLNVTHPYSSKIFISEKRDIVYENEILEFVSETHALNASDNITISTQELVQNILNKDENLVELNQCLCNVCGIKCPNERILNNHTCIKNVNDHSTDYLSNSDFHKRIQDVNMLNISLKNQRCTECDQHFDSQSLLKVHMMKHHEVKPWQCDYKNCGKTFLHKSSMEIHKATHRSDRPWLCDHCGKSFTHVSNLRVHKRNHLDDDDKKRHKCEVCGKAFRSRFLVRNHMMSHTGERPFLCDQCPKCFTTKERLKQHVAIHQTIHPFHCSVCSFSSVRRGNLLKHCKTHTKNTFECKVCRICFPNTTALFNHYRAHSEEELKQVECADKVSASHFQCADCGKFLSSKASLNTHKRMHAGIRPFLCTECGKRFTQKPALDYHWRLHTGERPHSCKFCGRGFNSKAGKDSHERVHTGEKPYRCRRCNTGFRCSANLRQHELTHEDNRAFQCSQCDKQFRRREALQIHMRTHTGERPYSCPTCGRSFTQKGDMKKHVRSHNSKLGQENCVQCSQTFKNKKQLKLHACRIKFVDKDHNLETGSQKNEDLVTTFPDVTIVTSDIQEYEVEYQS